MNAPEVIIAVGAEGGSITLFGQKDEFGQRDAQGAWRFSRAVLDQTYTFLSEEDGPGPEINHSSDWVRTWPEAMILMDRYPWAMLYGQEVHPDFRDRVWAEVNERLQDANSATAERAREHWARVCAVTRDHK
jgi:hypothetical protein